eukprot:GSMAST32.ASY1.ANO1.1834.1 assembled CDS
MIAGVSILVILIPIQKIIAGYIATIAKTTLKCSDERLETVTECLIVKTFCLEEIMRNRVKKARKKELRSLWYAGLLREGNVALMLSGPLLCALSSFALFVLISDDELTASKAFVSLVLFNMLRMPLILIPMSVGMVVRGYVSAKRITEFLRLDNIQGYIQKNNHGVNAVVVNNATFSFTHTTRRTNDDEQEYSPVVDNIDSMIEMNDTAFLHSLLGEMHLVHGSVSVGGTTAFVGQSPWIYNATVKENIIFGTHKNNIGLDKERYSECLQCCCLLHDLETLPNGDETEIGERGVNISGGQRARVALARAIYSNPDVLFLDDVLSAVDVDVCRHLVEECIVPMIKQGKTVVIATHSINWLKIADQVIVVNEGAIEFNGSAADLSVTKVKLDSEKSQKSQDGRLTKTETMQEGSVKSQVLQKYISYAGVFLTIVVLSSVILQNASALFSDWVLSRWAEDRGSRSPTTKKPEHSHNYWLGMYALTALGTLISICVFRVSKKLHRQMINRFGSDTRKVDNDIFTSIMGMLTILVSIICVLVLQILLLWWLIASVIPLFFVYAYFAKIYRSCSPLASGGLQTIRSFGVQRRFMDQMADRIDNHSRAWTKNNFVNRWMGTRLDWIGAFLVGGVAFGTTLDTGMIGLLIVATSQVSSSLNWGVRRVSEMESNLVSVERILEVVDDVSTDSKIVIPSAIMRYRENLPLVLKGINFIIPAASSVGVVGRTGSGKSSLINVLVLHLRLVEPSDGIISIDGIDCSKIDLNVLRTIITAVPQEAVMFSGSLRENVRFNFFFRNEFDDAQCLEALAAVELQDFVQTLSEGLSTNVSALSAATSHIDHKTDSKIQSWISQRTGLLNNTTIFIIAHRINTVMDCDHIIVMDDGKIIEFGNPKELLSNGGAFKTLLYNS